MRRLSLCLAVVVGALVAASAARADGPTFVTQFGQGVTHGSVRYVPVSVYPTNHTDLVTISTVDGSAGQALQLPGQWGLPYIGAGAEGLSRDGRTLVLGEVTIGILSPSRFLIVDPARMKVVRTIVLRGYFSFDALSPDASRMYLIQYTHGQSQDLTHYIVRGYDLRANRLLPGKIADRREHEESMAGYAMTRTTSANGRWVYTLYQKPSGEPFVHALDTVAAAAYCIDLPKNRGLYNIVLSLRGNGRTLAVHSRSGRPWLNVAVGSWRISYPSSGFPWAWVGAGIGGALAVLAAAGLIL
ncbi:MAG TPA: hypothetical protein VFJ11_06515, partial [Gaiellaceae bacterium]|nr:hypothetical protein [Gaiellaceae bacterium]